MNRITRKIAPYFLVAAGAIADLVGCATTNTSYDAQMAFESGAYDYLARAVQLSEGYDGSRKKFDKRLFDDAIRADALGDNNGEVSKDEARNFLRWVAQSQSKE